MSINFEMNPLVRGSPARPSMNILKHILKNLFSINNPDRLFIEKSDVSSPEIAENIRKIPIN